MRKLILVAAVAVMACGAAFAQKGMQGIGVNIGIRSGMPVGYRTDGAPDYKGIAYGIDIKYQNNTSNYYRIEPFVSYNRLEDLSEFQVGLNNNVFFCSVRRFRPYFLFGVGYSYMMFDYRASRYDNDGHFYYEEVTKSGSLFNFRGGFGIDYRFTHSLSGQLEFGVSGLTGDIYRQTYYWQLKAGVAYNF